MAEPRVELAAVPVAALAAVPVAGEMGEAVGVPAARQEAGPPAVRSGAGVEVAAEMGKVAEREAAQE